MNSYYNDNFILNYRYAVLCYKLLIKEHIPPKSSRPYKEFLLLQGILLQIIYFMKNHKDINELISKNKTLLYFLKLYKHMVFIVKRLELFILEPECERLYFFIKNIVMLVFSDTIEYLDKIFILEKQWKYSVTY